MLTLETALQAYIHKRDAELDCLKSKFERYKEKHPAVASSLALRWLTEKMSLDELKETCKPFFTQNNY